MPRKGWSKASQSQVEPIRKTPMEKWRESEEKRKAREKRASEKRKVETKTYTVRVYRGSEIEKATEKAASDAGKQPGRYVRQALIEKLQKEGYIGEIPEEPEPEE